MSVETLRETSRMRYRFMAGAALLLGLLTQALPAYAIPPIEHWLTDNGLRVYYVHAPELPMVDLNITFANFRVQASSGVTPAWRVFTVNGREAAVRRQDPFQPVQQLVGAFKKVFRFGHRGCV